MHALEIREDGTASMFSGENITPWHGLGEVVEGVKTAAEALQLSGLDWQVEKRPVFFGNDEDGKTPFPGQFVNVRMSDNRPLGVVSQGYQIFQNEEAFSFFDNVVESNEAKYTSAGSLFGGKRVFLTAQVGDTFNVAGEDAHNMYLLITNSHDGSQAFTAAITTIRAVCNNTVTLGLAAAKNKWTLRHQSSLRGRVAEARAALEMTFKYEDAFQKEVERMMQIEVDKDKFLKIVDGIIPESKLQHEKAVDGLMDVFENEKTVIDAPGVGTAWGAYNAVTFWTDHVRNYQTDASKFKSLVDGGFASSVRNKAHKNFLALV